MTKSKSKLLQRSKLFQKTLVDSNSVWGSLIEYQCVENHTQIAISRAKPRWQLHLPPFHPKKDRTRHSTGPCLCHLGPLWPVAILLAKVILGCPSNQYPSTDCMIWKKIKNKIKTYKYIMLYLSWLPHSITVDYWYWNIIPIHVFKSWSIFVELIIEVLESKDFKEFITYWGRLKWPSKVLVCTNCNHLTVVLCGAD